MFPDHEPLVTVAAPGVITVRRNKEDDDSKLEYFAIDGGVVEIHPAQFDCSSTKPSIGLTSSRPKAKRRSNEQSPCATKLPIMLSSKKPTK